MLDAKRSVLGDKHPDTLYAMVTLAESYLGESRLDKAEALLLQALPGCRTALDRNHETTDAALAMLAAIYSMKARPAETRAGVDRGGSRSRDRDMGPITSSPPRETWRQQSSSFIQKNYVKAESCLRERLAYFVKKSPADWNRFVAESELGGCLIAEKKYDEAESLFALSLRWDEGRGSDLSADAEVGASRDPSSRPSGCYDSSGKKDVADEWRQKTLRSPGCARPYV